MSTRSRLRNLTARFKDFATKSRRARAGRGRLPEKRPRQPASAAHFSKLRNKWRRTRDEQAAKIGPRRLRRIVIATVLAFCAYPVLGTLALWTGLLERVLASEDMTVQIENPAWTVFPGRVHLSSVRLLVNGQTQFLLQGDEVVADVHLFDLFRRRFHVTDLDAKNVVYRMRLQVENPRAEHERLAAYPPLNDLPGMPTLDEKTAERTEKREKPWTVQVEGIDVQVSELWFMEYRYLGDGRLRGGFLRGPGVMRVDTSVQDIGPGELRFGADQLIASRFRGTLEAEIPEVDPEKHADLGFFGFVTARLQLRADVQNMRHVSAYLDSMKVTDGKGPFAADLRIEKGLMTRGSHLRYRTNQVRLIGDGFGLRGDLALNLSVGHGEQPTVPRSAAPDGSHEDEAIERTAGSESTPDQATREPRIPRPRLRLNSDITYVSLTKRSGTHFTIQLHDHQEAAILKSNDLRRLNEFEQARIRLPDIRMLDLDDLDSLGSKDLPLETKSGTGRGSLELTMDENHVFRGPLELDLSQLKFAIAGVNLGGNAQTRCRVRLDPDSKTASLSDVALNLSDFEMHVGDEDVEGWWLRFATQRIALWGLPPKRVKTKFEIIAKDAEPLLEALAEKDKLNDLIAKFTSLDDISVLGTLRAQEDTVDLMLHSVESDVFDIAGRIYTSKNRKFTALVIGGEAISLGIANLNGDSDIEPFADSDWLNQKLRRFPKPIEQVVPPKP